MWHQYVQFKTPFHSEQWYVHADQAGSQRQIPDVNLWKFQTHQDVQEMMIVQMEKLVSTDNVKTHVIVELELNVLSRITDQSVSVLQDMLEILRSPVSQLDVNQMETAETVKPASKETVLTHVWSRILVEDLPNVTQQVTELTADVCQDMRVIHLLDVK